MLMVNSLCMDFLSIHLHLCVVILDSRADNILELLASRVQVEFQLTDVIL